MAALLGKSIPLKKCLLLTVSSRYYSWMGSSSIRRDILSQYRAESATSRGRRGRRGRRAPKDADSHRDGTEFHAHTRALPHTYDTGSDKENTYVKQEDADDDTHVKQEDVEDDDEFFDAEDASADEDN
jgi:hypothetical protein